MTTLVTSNFSTVKSNGTRHNGNCKPVLCIDTGVIYNSLTDAAEANGVSFGAIHLAVRGRTKKCKGMRWCLLSEVGDNIQAMTENIRRLAEAEEKAAKWDAYVKEQERLRKEEEKKQAEIEKVRARVERYTETRNQNYRKYLESEGKLAEAEHLLAELTGESIHVVA